MNTEFQPLLAKQESQKDKTANISV